MSFGRRRAALFALALAAVVLVAAHHDAWLWTDRSLVFGFLPSGLLYHALYSVAAAVFWAVAAHVAWPRTMADGLEVDERRDGAPEGASEP